MIASRNDGGGLPSATPGECDKRTPQGCMLPGVGVFQGREDRFPAKPVTRDYISKELMKDRVDLPTYPVPAVRPRGRSISSL